jgi:hypothetical protein
VTASDDQITAKISGGWDGSSRIDIEALEVCRTDSRSLTPRDLTRVQLADVVRKAAGAMVRPGQGAHMDLRPGRKPTPDELKLVAAVYWYHHVAWSHPRRAVMAMWDLPRTTASRWINRASGLWGPLPSRAEDD